MKRYAIMNGVANAKFKKGDRVVLVKSGDKGEVSEAYGDEWYAVWRDGAQHPDKVQGWQIKSANAVGNAKFKKGDRVKYKGENPSLRGKAGKVEAVKEIAGLEWVTIKDGGVTYHSPHFNWVATNAVGSTNAVVQKALAARNAWGKFRTRKHGVISGFSQKDPLVRKYEWMTNEIVRKDSRGLASQEEIQRMESRLDDLQEQMEEKGYRFDKYGAVTAVPGATNSAMNAGDMKSKKFGDVEAREFGGDRPSWEIGMNLNGLVSAFSVKSKEDCIAKANALIDALKRKAEDCAKAIQWMKNN